MVEVHFKLIGLGSMRFDLAEPLSWGQLLELCRSGRELEQRGMLAVRDGRILNPDDLVADGDVVQVFPAISGG
jgi:molybdopterin converting factor small subunit